MAISALMLSSCGGVGTTAPSTLPAAESPAVAPTSADDAAWLAAQAAIQKVAADAVLLSMGAGRVAALSELSDSWTFAFFSPSANQPYSVTVKHGVAQAPEALAAPEAEWTVRTVADIESIRVGAAQAVAKARKVGEKSGALLKYVQVSGFFGEIPPAVQLGMKTGVWNVTLATNAEMSDALVFEVDMMTGAVSDLN